MYRTTPIIIYITFGIHIATRADVAPEMAKELVMVENSI